MKQMKYVSKSIYRLKYELEKDCYNNNNYRLTVISWTFNNKAMLTVGIFVDLAWFYGLTKILLGRRKYPFRKRSLPFQRHL